VTCAYNAAAHESKPKANPPVPAGSRVTFFAGPKKVTKERTCHCVEHACANLRRHLRRRCGLKRAAYLHRLKREPLAMVLLRQCPYRQCSSRFGKSYAFRRGPEENRPPLSVPRSAWAVSRSFRHSGVELFATEVLHASGRRFLCLLSFRRDKKKVRRGAGRSARGLPAPEVNQHPIPRPFSCYRFFK
jgi:hypothetical protein